MKIKTYREFGSLNSRPIFDAFENGVITAGDKLVDSYEEADVVVIWSVLFAGRMAGNKNVWDQAWHDRKPIIVLEVGSINRDTTWKMGIGGINNDALWCKPYEQNRAEKLGIQIQEFSSTGEFITICTQRPDSQQWQDMPSIEDWVLDQIHYVQKLEMNLPIVVRPHPRDKITNWSFLNNIKDTTNVYFDTPRLVDGTYDSFNHGEIFNRSRIVINHSSGPAVQAAIKGLEVITGDASLAWPIALNNDNQISKDEWIEQLAHTEFTVEELSSGIPWENLKYEMGRTL